MAEVGGGPSVCKAALAEAGLAGLCMVYVHANRLFSLAALFVCLFMYLFMHLFILRQGLTGHPGYSAMALPWLAATPTSWAQVIRLPWPLEAAGMTGMCYHAQIIFEFL